MKKLNKKGFLIAESIIVGVFVLSLFTFLFVNVVPLVGQYEAREKYDTINGAYNANLVRTMILEDNKMEQVLELNNLPYKIYEREDLCTVENLEKANYCTKLLGDAYLNVDKIYITWYRTEEIKKASRNNDIDFNRAARDYIDSLDGYKQPSGSTYDNYKRIIVQYNDGGFANIEVKISEVQEDAPAGGGGVGSSGDELGCILTAQPAAGTKKGNNNWYTSDVKIYMTKTGAVVEYGLTTTETPLTPVYNSKIVAEQTEDTEGITYYGYVKDIDGFEETCSIFIKKDTTSPEVVGSPETPTPQIYNPTNGNPTNLPFSLTVKASDPESGIDYWYYSYDEENWIKYDDPAYDSYEKDEYLTSPFSTERNEDVYIKVCNKAGLCGVNSTRINIDTTPPGCTITPNGTEKDGYYTTNVRFDLSPDAGTIKYLIASTQQNMASMTQASFDNQLQKTMTTDTNGTSWYGYIMDPAGNIGECKSRPVKRDTTPPPQPQITNPTGGNWTKDPFSLTVKSTDSNSGNGYWYYSYDTTPDDSKNWEIYNESGYNSLGKTEFVTSPFSKERAENVYIRACDKVGNCSISASTMIAIDKTKPICEFITNRTINSNGWYNAASGTPLNVSITPSDGGTVRSGVVAYNISTNASPSYSGSLAANSIADTPGQTYYCYVKDAAGNENEAHVEIKKDTIAPTHSTYSLDNTAVGNLRSYITGYSGGSALNSWVQNVSCSGGNCTIYGCSSSRPTSFALNRGVVSDYVGGSDDTSGFNYTSNPGMAYPTCSSFPCTASYTHYAYDKAGNYKSFTITWNLNYPGGPSSTCSSGSGGTGK